ncbi:MAG TPA: hypothetical protein VHT05_06695 [Candidatus Elarobacter sp.]|jgi:hypothetical protein|nr:hypothetical protein [Candidatus Elarobacter sp.]
MVVPAALRLGALPLLASMIAGIVPHASTIPVKPGFRCYGSTTGFGANLPMQRSDDAATLVNMFILPQHNSVAAWLYENKEHRFWLQLRADASRTTVHDDLTAVGALVAATSVSTVSPMVINEYPLTRSQVLGLWSRHALTPCFRDWRTRL